MSVTIEQIIAEDARYCANITVQISSRYEFVAIVDDDGVHEDIFMQGHAARAFEEELRELIERAPDVTMDDAAKHLARQYVDNLWN
jgi:hypothetical protein